MSNREEEDCAGAKGVGLRPESFLIEAKACAGETAQAVATCGRVEKKSGKQRGGDPARIFALKTKAWRETCAGEAAQTGATCGRVQGEATE